MQFHDHDAVVAATSWPELIGALAEGLSRAATSSPDRHVHDLAQPDGSTGALLLMPSWEAGRDPGLEAIGVKVVTYYPANAGSSTPTVNAAYLLFDGPGGRPVAVLDGDALTTRRTAAVSALAARHLARSDARSLLVVGTGQLAPNLALAHAEGRDLDSVTVWGRRRNRADRVAAGLVAAGLPAGSTDDLEAAVSTADIVTCATGANAPLVDGGWLQPGTHLDLVGSFRADMRESDDVAVTRATLFVDTFAGAVAAGDLAQPMAAGVIAESDVVADLSDLVTGRHAGRTGDTEITLFKSAGFAAADLFAARLVAGI